MEYEDSFYVGNVSTFPPRRCGVGSFAKDMIESFSGDIKIKDWEAVPIVWEFGKAEYYPEHRNHIRKEILQSSPESFENAARYITETTEYFRDYGVESGWFINHEYGIFAEHHSKDNAVNFLRILKERKVPNIVIGHTVLSNPDEQKKEVMKGILENTDKFICLTPSAINILMRKYNAPRGKLIYIPHGVPKFYVKETRDEIKKEMGFLDKDGNPRHVFTSFGHLSPGKGLEYSLDGFSRILGQHPDTIYFIAGATHPEVLREEGEKYRENLESFLKEKGVRGVVINEEGKIRDIYGNPLDNLTDVNVVFLNRHLLDKEIPRIMKGSDFGVVGNLEEEQISSGPGAYWIGSSRITIATASLFFKDMEDVGIGLLVPFRDPDAYADRMSHCLKLSKIDRDELEFIASDFGSTNTWSNVGDRYLNLMEKIIMHKKGLRNND